MGPAIVEHAFGNIIQTSLHGATSPSSHHRRPNVLRVAVLARNWITMSN
jgi:hypothetical protein